MWYGEGARGGKPAAGGLAVGLDTGANMLKENGLWRLVETSHPVQPIDRKGIAAIHPTPRGVGEGGKFSSAVFSNG